MLNKENYVPWSSHLLRYAKSKPNGKLLVNFIRNGPYVRRMIHELGDPNNTPPVVESTHEQTDDELTNKEVKQMEADDQAIQTILMGLPKDIYAVVDSYDTTKEIWLHVEQMMKGSNIGAQEKKAKLFNEWETFNSTKGESIESYYHRFAKLMNDFSRNKHFTENIANYTIEDEYGARQTYANGPIAGNQNGYNAVQNARNQVGQNAVQKPGVQHVGNQNRLIVVLGIANQNGNGNVIATWAKGNGNGQNGNQIRCYNCRRLCHYAMNCTITPRRRDAAYLQTRLLIVQKEEAWIQLQAEEFDLMAVAGDIDDIEEVNVMCRCE
ncbi:integrase, catalytic region, zinc finger, CCHC-type containing protein, partial [Tanacetum coccineum]